MDTFPLSEIRTQFDALEASNEAIGGIDVIGFCDAHFRLVKFFSIFGTPFAFAEDDVTKKVAIIKERMASYGADVKTCKDAIKHEMANDVIAQEPKRNVSRNLLRLIRSLEYLALFFTNFAKEFDNTKLEVTDISWSAYQATMQKHHSFVMRSALSAAHYAIPYRKDLYKMLDVSVEELPKVLEALGSTLRTIHSHVHSFYEEMKLTELP